MQQTLTTDLNNKILILMFVDQAIKVLSYSYAAIRLIVLVKKIIGSFKYVNAT